MTFDDSRLRKRVAWLNNAGGFDNQIIYTKVAAAAEGLSDGRVMEILKYLEDNYSKVGNPMRWILSSLEKAQTATEGFDAEFDRQLRRRVRWLNNEGGFENKIMYSKLAEASAGLESKQVMEVLKYLEERWEYIDDPTAWACTGLRKAASGGAGGGGGRSYGSAGGGGGGAFQAYRRPGGEFYDKLWRRILWLNTKGGFNHAIQYDRITDAVHNSEGGNVWELLNYVEANWQQVGDPTGWIVSSLNKAGSRPAYSSNYGESGYHRGGSNWSGGGGYPQQTGSYSGYRDQEWDDGKDREIRRRIRSLNTEGGFQNSIIYDKISEAAQGVELQVVLHVLGRLEENWDRVEDPNAWVCAGLRKSNVDFDRKLRTRVRWLNNEGGFENKINYSKISQASVGMSEDHVMVALRYLEEKGPVAIEDPTSWVCAGLSKVKRGAMGGGVASEDRRPPLRQRWQEQGADDFQDF